MSGPRLLLIIITHYFILKTGSCFVLECAVSYPGQLREVMLVECDEKRAGDGSYTDRFLQPAVLLALLLGKQRGFMRDRDISESGMIPKGTGRADICRALRRMEAAGLVVSRPDAGYGAKPERVYAITDRGVDRLEELRSALEENRINENDAAKGTDGGR